MWSVLWPIPSLTIPEGNELDLAGFTLSALSEAEVTGVREEHELIAQTMRIGEHGEPGSALPHMRDVFDKTISSSVCWARGAVRARTASVDRIAAEEIRIALAVLRTFALYIGINPDDTLLDVPPNSNIRRAILYRPGAALSFPSTRYERRIPYIMSRQQIERLRQFDLFQRAQAIAATEHPTQLEQKLLLAMLQFDTAATLDAPESKLPHYLTVIETLLAREEGNTKIAGRKPRVVCRRSQRVIPSARVSGLPQRIYTIFGPGPYTMAAVD